MTDSAPDVARADLEPDAETPPEPTADERATEQGVRFDDAYWDDAFCAWWDPSMRICC